jgi:hypothetical protein
MVNDVRGIAYSMILQRLPSANQRMQSQEGRRASASGIRKHQKRQPIAAI